MGYRLTGKKIKSDITGILSEGICPGAIQIPADGQPIVLLNDRQTIGGYPKIGAVIASDTAKLSQLSAGQKVHFDPISMEAAHNIHHLARSLFKRTLPIHCH
jgi:allophanate hydrolase subunit 2